MVATERKRKIVYDYIRTYIDQNKFTVCNRLPSENYLCGRCSVSRETVRAAIRQLFEEGFTYAVKGSGTYFHRTKALLNPYFAKTGDITIGLILQGQDFNANSNLVKGIRTTLDQVGAVVRIFQTDNKLINERRCLMSCRRGFQGLIVDGVKASILNPNLDCYADLYSDNLPVIFYNNFYKDTFYPKVINDDFRCADALIQRLTEKGHSHIMGIFVYDNYQGVEKYQGYVHALFKYKARFDDKYVKWCISDEVYDKDNYPKTLWRFIKSQTKCTAIVCCNYMILQYVLKLLADHGRRVPEDYSIVSFDYSNTDWETTGITSSIHPGFDMGVEVSNRIVRMVNDPQYKKHDYSHVFSPTIYDGSSIKDLR